MTTPREVLEAMVDHLDAGGTLSVTSPLYAMHADLAVGDDDVSDALLDLAHELEQGSTLDAAHLYVAAAREALGRVSESQRATRHQELREVLGAIAEALTPEEEAAPGNPVEKTEVMAAIGVDPNFYSAEIPRFTLPTSILALPHGLHRDVTPAVYYAKVPGLVSKSVLDLVHRSPAHVRAWLEGAFEENSDAMSFGQAFHVAALEPDLFAGRFLVEPSFKGKGSVKAREAWREEHEGATFIDADDMRAIAGMVASLRAHPRAAELLEEGLAEVTARWCDEETGLEAKARFDFYAPDIGAIIDLKSTTDARADAFRRSVASYRYHVQTAVYLDGCAAAGGDASAFYFIAVEKTPPYAVAVFDLDDDAIRKGRFAAREDMATLARAFETDTWAGYPEHVQTLELPRWA